MILSISGKIGSGKDTVANIIQYLTSEENSCALMSFETYLLSGRSKNSSWQVKKFAYKLKQIVALLTGCTVEQLEDQEFKKQLLGKEWLQYFKIVSASEFTPEQIQRHDRAKQIIVAEEFIPTYRWLLQQVGTEAMRDNIHENVWVNALFSDYIPTIVRSEVPVRASGFLDRHVYPNWIISDMRFPNEMQAVKDRGGITIRIHRDTFFRTGDFSVSTHPSETALDESKFDYEIENNGTIEELIKKVKKILIAEKII